MSDTVITVLIVALTIVVVLFMFREQLQKFIFKANKEGIEAQLETSKDKESTNSRKRASVSIRGNKQIGKGNMIDVGRSNVEVEENTQVGQNQKIIARPNVSKKTNKSTKKR